MNAGFVDDRDQLIRRFDVERPFDLQQIKAIFDTQRLTRAEVNTLLLETRPYGPGEEDFVRFVISCSCRIGNEARKQRQLDAVIGRAVSSMWMQVTGLLWTPARAAEEEEAKGADSAETGGLLQDERTYRPEDIKLVSAYRSYPKVMMLRAGTHGESPSVPALCVA